MEIKINSEVRDYTESIFFGLSMKQLIFGALTIGSSVAAYFLLREKVTEMNELSIYCVMAAIPAAVIGFVKYNGMSATEFAKTWLKAMLTPSRLVYRGSNLYYDLLKSDTKETIE